MSRTPALILAIFIGFAAVAIPSALQPQLQAGSIPDLVCSLILAPGWLTANLFLDRGTASPEFLPVLRLTTFILFGGVVYGFLTIKKPTI